uniref:hypothetical protein n=1 Tax=Serratia proteamaculans TaxID=28151 RepID=UPI001F4C0374|nr:hypothetical protein [Serratia proteamaculans]
MLFADGQIRRDLFSEDNDGYVDRVLLETHVTNKLEMIAHALQDYGLGVVSASGKRGEPLGR